MFSNSDSHFNNQGYMDERYSKDAYTSYSSGFSPPNSLSSGSGPAPFQSNQPFRTNIQPESSKSHPVPVTSSSSGPAPFQSNQPFRSNIQPQPSLSSPTNAPSSGSGPAPFQSNQPFRSNIQPGPQSYSAPSTSSSSGPAPFQSNQPFRSNIQSGFQSQSPPGLLQPSQPSLSGYPQYPSLSYPSYPPQTNQYPSFPSLSMEVPGQNNNANSNNSQISKNIYQEQSEKKKHHKHRKSRSRKNKSNSNNQNNTSYSPSKSSSEYVSEFNSYNPPQPKVDSYIPPQPKVDSYNPPQPEQGSRLNKNQSKPKPEPYSIIPPKPVDPQSSDEDEEYIESDSEPSVELLEPPYVYIMTKGKCSICHKKHPDNQIVLKICANNHYGNAECLNTYLKEWIKKPESGTTWPRCAHSNCELDIDVAVLNYIDRETKEKVNDTSFKLVMNKDIKASVKRNRTQITCPNPKCKQSYIFEPNFNTDNFIAPDGEKLTPEHLSHFNKYRCLCPFCRTEFCTNCKVLPYHYHYNCEEYKQKDKLNCKYCGGKLVKGKCPNQECAEFEKNICKKILPCGHQCNGVVNEKKHLPCIHPDCIEKNHLKINEDCIICYTELQGPPVVQLKCGHLFHFHCIKRNIEEAIKNNSTTFAYLLCPECKQIIQSPLLTDIMKPLVERKKRVTEKAVKRLKYEGRDKDDALVNPNSRFYNKPDEYALHLYVYFICSKCKNICFGGAYNCMPQDADPQEERICGACSSLNKDVCRKHGARGLTYKCRYCCNIACWFCWGTTHFCEKCHQKAATIAKTPKNQLPKCPGPDRCPLGIAHPPNGEEYCIGCSLCQIEDDDPF